MQTESQERTRGEMFAVTIGAGKNFCFVREPKSGEVYFLHASDLYGGRARMCEGGIVEFDVELDNTGPRPLAKKAVLIKLQPVGGQ